VAGAFSCGLAQASPLTGLPVVGLDEAYSIKSNTSSQAIERGVKAAIDEINAKVWVLGGRPLKLITTDNQGVPARGKDNLAQMASQPDVIAVLGVKFSPVTVESISEAQRLRLPLISVWGLLAVATARSWAAASSAPTRATCSARLLWP
jgi:branched-chain amino acid transport system substrate-binding protein